jgi:hypothetical protein
MKPMPPLTASISATNNTPSKATVAASNTRLMLRGNLLTDRIKVKKNASATSHMILAGTHANY